MLNKELLIIAIVVILGLFAVILVQNFDSISNHGFDDIDGFSNDVTFQGSGEGASS